MELGCSLLRFERQREALGHGAKGGNRAVDLESGSESDSEHFIPSTSTH